MNTKSKQIKWINYQIIQQYDCDHSKKKESPLHLFTISLFKHFDEEFGQLVILIKHKKVHYQKDNPDHIYYNEYYTQDFIYSYLKHHPKCRHSLHQCEQQKCQQIHFLFNEYPPQL